MNTDMFIIKLKSYLEGFSKATADTFAWFSILVFNAAIIPTLVSVMAGHTGKMPPMDIVLMIWFGLILFFVRSVILKDMLMTVTIGVGFAVQSILMGVIFFI